MKYIKLGNLEVSRIGLGTMGMSAYYTIDTAEKERLPKRRDLAVLVFQERMGDDFQKRVGKATVLGDAEFAIRLNRTLFMQ